MTAEDLHPPLPNRITIQLQDNSKFFYAVSDDVAVEIFQILNDEINSLPVGAFKLHVVDDQGATD